MSTKVGVNQSQVNRAGQTWSTRRSSRSLPKMEATSVDGRWIRQRRRELDYTQEQLAELFGCTSSMLKKIERGERSPSAALTARIVEALGSPKNPPSLRVIGIQVLVAETHRILGLQLLRRRPITVNWCLETGCRLCRYRRLKASKMG
jgi:transcriptional regulator with XRE-family HTH domain